MPDACSIYSTHPSLEQARATADALLTQRLVACCNIIPGVESHYVWEGARETTQEVAMLSKTSVGQAPAVIAAINAAHPYDCPAILQWPITGGSPDFLGWVVARSTGVSG